MIRAYDIDPETGQAMWEVCASCNLDMHRCPLCGADLSHDGYDSGGNLHDTAYCRPDLVEHEPGETCTWPDDPELNKYRDPWCYWDHENNRLRD